MSRTNDAWRKNDGVEGAFVIFSPRGGELGYNGRRSCVGVTECDS